MISAVILAAGQSKRMGRPKMLLPWGKVTVIEHVVAVFARANVDEIVVVTGGARVRVEEVLERCAERYPVRSVFNEEFTAGEMMSSIKRGVNAVKSLWLNDERREASAQASDAILIGLGDQPQIEERSVRLVMDAYIREGGLLVVPSFEMRRGHPWLVAEALWSPLLGMNASATPRDFLNRYADRIQYVNVESRDVLADLDTPEDYQAAQPSL